MTPGCGTGCVGCRRYGRTCCILCLSFKHAVLSHSPGGVTQPATTARGLALALLNKHSSMHVQGAASLLPAALVLPGSKCTWVGTQHNIQAEIAALHSTLQHSLGVCNTPLDSQRSRDNSKVRQEGSEGTLLPAQICCCSKHPLNCASSSIHCEAPTDCQLKGTRKCDHDTIW